MERNDLLSDDQAFLDAFNEWLFEHDYCKVTRCCQCYNWQPLKPGRARTFISGRCRRYDVDKWADDWCSDALKKVYHD